MKFAQNANYVSEARFLANRRSWRRGRPAPAMLPLGTRCGLHHAARRTLTLLGELEPIARQLFVAPFAFFLPATIGKLSAFCRVRTESFRLAVRRLNLARPIAGGEEIHSHSDLHHLPPCPRQISTVVTLACDCDHKNAFFHRWSGVAPPSAKTMFLERVRGELSACSRGFSCTSSFARACMRTESPSA
jgi:hypothetical protein